MKRRLILSVLTGLVTTVSFGQQWLQNQTVSIQNGTAANYYELRGAFNTYFETHDQGKGTGYKQFLRYMAFIEPRVYPTGIFPAGCPLESKRAKGKQLG